MTSVTDVTEDIMEAARTAAGNCIAVPDIAYNSKIIAGAILAERTRCAKIADDAVAGRSRQMATANARNDRKAARDFESMKFEAIEIAAAIRSKT